MGDRSLERRLRDFGFSEKEAAIYRAVLELGEAKPSEIASKAEVSTRYAYEVGERLEERGFLTVHDQVTPTTIRARQPEEAIEGLAGELAALEPVLRERYEEPSENTLEVQIIKTRMTLHKRLTELIEKAEQEIVLAIPAAALDELEASLKAARERGVFVLLIAIAPSDGFDVPDVADVVRVNRHYETGVLATDYAISVVMTADMVTKTNTDDRAIACLDGRLTRLMVSGFIGDMWLMGEELSHVRPAPLPASFRHFREAVLHATLHKRANTDCVAEVRGEHVRSGDPLTVTGRITEIKQTLVEPISSDFPGEQSVLLDLGDSDIWVGGSRAFLEDVKAHEVILQEA